MAYLKNIKTRQYFKRFQVKYRRRREGKTDYRARLRLVTQDKNKYNTPKYRFAVRFSNRDICCQVIYATMAGDVVVAAAYAHELPHFGLTVGLTNYAACYATGLLCARRLLKKFKLDETYEGNNDPEKIGEDYNVEATEEGPRPFKALLDVGLVRTSSGAKVFGALKGALDGGIDIPHGDKRFAGFLDGKLDADELRKYITGGHVAEYMEEMKEEEPEKYKQHFSAYIKAGVKPDDYEDLVLEALEKIRANPIIAKKARTAPKKATLWKTPKLTYEQRKTALKAKLAALQEAE